MFFQAKLVLQDAAGNTGEFWAKATGTKATALTTNAINAATLKAISWQQ